MSIIPDFVDRVRKAIDAKSSAWKDNLATGSKEDHDKFAGRIAGLKEARSIVDSEFHKIGGEDE